MVPFPTLLHTHTAPFYSVPSTNMPPLRSAAKFVASAGIAFTARGFTSSYDYAPLTIGAPATDERCWEYFSSPSFSLLPHAQCYRSTEVRDFEKSQEAKALSKTSSTTSEDAALLENETADEKASRKLREAHSRERHSKEIFSARFKPYQLGDIIPITHDVALFRFLLHDTDDAFNLKPCSTLQGCYKYGVQAADQCQRFYTPITANGTKGYFDIIVKRKAEGKMTNHIFGLHIGDKMLFRSIGLKVQYRPNR